MIEVSDRDGWHRTFRVEKTILQIGSDPGNDVVLDEWRGAGVALRHLQLIALPDSDGMRRRLVNLGDTAIVVGGEAEQVVAPRSFVDIATGDSLNLGDFNIVFRGDDVKLAPLPDAAPTVRSEPLIAQPGIQSAPLSAPGSSQLPHPAAEPNGAPGRHPRASGAIGLRVLLNDSRLDPEGSVAGSVLVRNLGNRTGVQFKVALEGLDPDSYELGPGPILFPNAEREVPLVLRHPRRPKPPAGDHEVRIVVTAPEAYPGESAVVVQKITVMPYAAHELHLTTGQQV